MLARRATETAAQVAWLLHPERHLMYDATFDHSRDRRLLWLARVAALIAIGAVASSAEAQMPGAPVLQNAWATPGIVGALNVAGSSGQNVVAAAAGWTPGSARFQVSGGVGYQTRSDFDGRVVYGARVAMPFGGASSTFGFAAFAGVGGGPAGKRTVAVTPGAPDSVSIADTVSSTTQIPLGASVAYRRAIGSNHGLSIYATPAWVIYSGGTKTDGLFRVAIGADFGITKSLGVTGGIDFGGTRAKELGGPSSTQYGVGVSYALGKR